MEQQVDLSALDGHQIDPETFRRVWARVMPDQRDSPLVLSPPAPAVRSGNRTEEKKRPVPREQPNAGTQSGEQKRSVPKAEDPERMERLMDLAREGAEGAGALARRMGSRGREMAGIAEDHRRALRRLAAAYFLMTGRRRHARGSAPGGNRDLGTELRERFLWEKRWEQACREAAEETGDPALEELCRELARDASLHQRAIRTTLERMWGGTVDGSRRNGVN